MSEELERQGPPPTVDRRFQFNMASLLILTSAFCVWLVVKARPMFEQEGAQGLYEACAAFASWAHNGEPYFV